MAVIRPSHQSAAASTTHIPIGSGTKNAPNVASATGELNWRNFVISRGKLTNNYFSGLELAYNMINKPPEFSTNQAVGKLRRSRRAVAVHKKAEPSRCFTALRPYGHPAE